MLMSLVDYQLLWYLLVGVVLVLVAFTMGFDLGVGSIMPFIGRSDVEKRIIINSIGPTWDGNQVWLIIAGGALFVIWPYAYALSFSGFYGAILLFLWALFLRPVGFEYRSKIKNNTWRHFWDTCIFLGSFIPAAAMGLLIGNLLQGVPFYYTATHRLIYTGNVWELFNGFAILTALVSASMLIMHGATFLQLKTTDDIQRRSRKTTVIFGLIFVILFVLAGYISINRIDGYQLVKAAGLNNMLQNKVTVDIGALFFNFVNNKWMFIAPILTFAGAGIAILASLLRVSFMAFLASTASVIGTIFTFGFAMFPFVIPSSTHPDMSLTLYNSSASHYTLQAIFIAAVIFLPTIGLYTLWVFKQVWGKVTKEEIEDKNEHSY